MTLKVQNGDAREIETRVMFLFDFIRQNQNFIFTCQKVIFAFPIGRPIGHLHDDVILLL